MRYAMDLKVTEEAISTIGPISESYSRHAVIVNDIYSFPKELRAWNRHHEEGAQIPNLVMLQAQETGVTFEAAMRVLWILCRECELEHLDLVSKREAAVEGCVEDLKIYMKGLEYIMGGNEMWSSYTHRYHERD